VAQVTRRAAVLGSPIAHSLSPALHLAAYSALDLPWHYDAVECDAARLPAFLAACRTEPAWAGVSLTMPLKTAAVPLVDTLGETAAAVGAVNTVVVRDGGLHGFNTDAYGAAMALAELGLSPPLRRVVVLGAGGAARAVLPALRGWRPEHVTVCARRADEATDLLGTLAVALPASRGESAPWDEAADAVARADVVVSTVPAGAADSLAAGWRGAALLDVVYQPWPTVLAQAAADRGARVCGGLPMLVFQAALAVELMTGRAAPLSVMRAAGEAALAART
jgi:shikimate dehydrogenase